MSSEKKGILPKKPEDAEVIEIRMRLSVLDKKIDSLLLADKYHRIFHAIYLSVIFIFIMFQ